MPSASFRFGIHTKHQVDIDCGYFGTEKYFVDRVLVLSRWTLRRRGTRLFKFNGHDIQVTIEISKTAAHGKAYVDGECVATDLFAEFNAQLPKFRSKQGGSVSADSSSTMAIMWKCGLWLACVLVIFSALRYLD